MARARVERDASASFVERAARGCAHGEGGAEGVKYIKSFLTFLYDFIVGDSLVIGIGIPLVRTSRQAGNRLLIDDALGPRRDQLDWRWEVLHIATAASMVAAGVGLTVAAAACLPSTSVATSFPSMSKR